MQIIILHPSPVRTAEMLHTKQLGRQRVDCKLVLNALYKANKWSQHPTVRMWRGYEGTLYTYYLAIVAEWQKRGYAHTMSIASEVVEFAYTHLKIPTWLESERLHEAHKSVLLRVNPVYYKPLFDEDVPHALQAMPHYVYTVDTSAFRQRVY